MNRLFITLVSALLLLSCNNETQPETTTTESVEKQQQVQEMSPENTHTQSPGMTFEKDNFKDFYHAFFVAFSESDAEFLNSCLPDKGAFVIEANGAMPQLSVMEDFSTFKRLDNRSILSIDIQSLGFEAIEEALPVVDCNSPTIYDKAGCFTQKINTLNDSKIWELESVKEEHKAHLMEMVLTTEYTVCNTSNYTYHFAFVENTWKLVFIDARRPCQA